MLDVFDHENRAFALLRFQFEPELLLHGGKDRWATWINRREPIAIK